MENSRKARYEQSPEQMDYHSNEVSIKKKYNYNHNSKFIE